jgi:hypothetical protein
MEEESIDSFGMMYHGRHGLPGGIKEFQQLLEPPCDEICDTSRKMPNTATAEQEIIKCNGARHYSYTEAERLPPALVFHFSPRAERERIAQYNATKAKATASGTTTNTRDASIASAWAKGKESRTRGSTRSAVPIFDKAIEVCS